jgi:hypothetical protein
VVLPHVHSDGRIGSTRGDDLTRTSSNVREDIMSLAQKLFGPRSKYDRSLPYTYVGRVRVLNEQDDLVNDYFADTICGLIEYLDQQHIDPEDVDLYGIYLLEKIPIDKQYCLDEQGRWLDRPAICRSLEEHYRKTLEEQYRGHVANAVCAFEDRRRTGSGPY